jgi:hypothetical protein
MSCDTLNFDLQATAAQNIAGRNAMSPVSKILQEQNVDRLELKLYNPSPAFDNFLQKIINLKNKSLFIGLRCTLVKPLFDMKF